MALVAFASAKGSPGVTTTALAVAAFWPREVLLVDADPAGGDVGIRMSGASGAPLDLDRGLVSLAAAGRKGLTADQLRDHAQQLSGGLDVLVGLRGPEQAAGLDGFWPALARVAAALPGVDVLVDVGRLGADPAGLPLLHSASLVVLTGTPGVSQVVHLRERLASLLPRLAGPGGHRPVVGAVLVTAPRADRDADAVTELLTRVPSPPDRIWRLAHDPRGAGVFDGVPVRHPERTDLARSARALAQELAALVATATPAPAAAPGPAAAPVPRQQPPDDDMVDGDLTGVLERAAGGAGYGRRRAVRSAGPRGANGADGVDGADSWAGRR